MAIAVQREEEPADHVPQRNVMIPRNHQLRPRQALEVIRGGLVLRSASALGEVAAGDQKRWRGAIQLVGKCLGDGQIDRAEVQVGDVGDRAHRRSEEGVKVRDYLIGLKLLWRGT